MSASALIAGRKHGESNLTVLAGPANPAEIRGKFRDLLTTPGDLAEIELWTSHAGVERRKRFESEPGLETVVETVPPIDQPPATAEAPSLERTSGEATVVDDDGPTLGNLVAETAPVRTRR